MGADPIQTADDALRAGFNPVPLWPHSKRPVHRDWTKRDPEEARDAFTQAQRLSLERGDTYPLNIGLLLGNGLVDVDIDHHRTLSLARKLLPETAMRHGRASSRNSHWWYRVEDYDLGLKKYALPDGAVLIEYRSTGGQTMIPPSYNPDHGEDMLWEGEPFGGDEGPATVNGRELHARVALMAFIATLADAWPQRGGRHDAYLALVGGLLRDADENGDPRIQPWWGAQIEVVLRLLADATHDEDGGSARVAESVPSTRAKILRGDRVQGWPTLARLLGDDGEAYVESLRRIASDIETLNGTTRNRVTARRESDEWWEAGQATSSAPVVEVASVEEISDGAIAVDGVSEDQWREDGTDPDDDDPRKRQERGTWRIVRRHEEWLDDAGNLTSPVLPGVVWRDDGVGLLYPGRINMLYGPSGSGKSLIAMSAGLQEVENGGRTLMIDLENGYDEIHERLQALGCPGGQRTPGWAYIEAEQPIASLQRDSWGQESTSPTGRANRDRFLRDLIDFDPTLIILDGTTTLFTMHGLDPNKATGVDTITSWLRLLCAHGQRTVLLLDHTNKNPKVGDEPTGSQHKKSMVQGTMLQVHGESPEVGGQAVTHLYAVKDRPGKVKREGYKDPAGEIRVADVTFHGSQDGSVRVTYEAPDPNNIILDLPGARPGPGRPKADTSRDVAGVLEVFRAAGAGVVMTRAEVDSKMSDPLPELRLKAAIASLRDGGAIEQIGAGRSTGYTLRGR